MNWGGASGRLELPQSGITTSRVRFRYLLTVPWSKPYNPARSQLQ